MSRAPAAARLVAVLLATVFLMTTAPASAVSPPRAVTPVVEDSDGPGRSVRIDDIDHPEHARAARVGKWPGDTIRYWADLPASYRWSLDAAVAAWNDTGLDMRFVESSRAKAKLEITLGNTHGALGYATVGYQRTNWVHLVPGLTKPSHGESPAYAKVLTARIIAHELGHNLGLGHSRGCQLMTAVVQLPDCRLMDAAQPGYYACRIADKPALDKAIGLYGGKPTQPPVACPVETLPPALTGVRFEGGFDDEEPVQLGWDPPPKTPPGSQVLALVSKGESCEFPVEQDFYKEARYADSLTVVRLDPTSGTWRPPTYGIENRCYGLQLVNRHGAGRQVQSQVLQSWMPQAAAPEVQAVRRYVGEWGAGYYKAVATWSPVDGNLLVIARPSGQCLSAWPTGVAKSGHRVSGDPGEPLAIDALDAMGDPVADPCFSFFVEGDNSSRTSLADTWQVGAEPAPQSPVINDVVRDARYAYIVDATFDNDVANLAVVVRPESQCVASWPGGDPEEHLVTNYVETPGVTRPCLSFFTVNASGAVNATPVTWQVPPAPAPPTPTLTDVSYDDGWVQGRTNLDADVFGLAAVEGPTGQCPSALPTGTDPADHAADLWYDDEISSTVFSTWTSGSAPCVTFFAFNQDGVVGPAVKKQF